MGLLRSDNGYYANIVGAATTTVKAGNGALLGIVVNAAAVSGSITIFDSLTGSGTKVGTITFPATLLANQEELQYRVQFNTGLTIVTVGAVDITVCYL
jgi:hypothetical protein